MSQQTIRAGFGKANITPPIGSRMHGFHTRDRNHGCEGVRDDLFVRALWLEQGDERALILGFDLLFFDRPEDDRLRGALGRALGLSSHQILTNCSHTHCGPMTHIWASGMYTPIDRLYTDSLCRSVVSIAEHARDSAVPVTMLAGETRTDVPMSRRLIDSSGQVQFKPNPKGVVYDYLPMCLFEAADGAPVCLLFSVSCHPSAIGGFLISADFPGSAMRRIDAHLGIGCSLFLQGVGGDAKPSTLVKDGEFHSSPEGADEAGRLIAEDVISALGRGLDRAEPDLAARCVEADCEMAALPDRAYLENRASDSQPDDLWRDWAKFTLRKLDRGEELPTAIPLTVHEIELGSGVRLVGLEGEAVADLGYVVRDSFPTGITFPLGYTDGCQLYLPSERVLREGGYEATSHNEYAWPAPFARGVDGPVADALARLNR